MKTQNPSRRKFMQQLSAAGMVLGMEGIASPVFAKSPLTKQKRVGIIGLDTSHSIEFTKLLNNDHADLKYNGYKVTVAYPKGSDAIESNPKKWPTIQRRYRTTMSALQHLLRNYCRKLMR